MRGVERGRYEGALSRMARGARDASNILRGAGFEEEAYEFALIAEWARSEFSRSAAEKRPLKGQTTLFPAERASTV